MPYDAAPTLEAPASTENKEIERFCKRYQRAKDKRDRVNQVIDEAYEFSLPLRERPYSSGEDYRARTERLFDSTAPGAVQDLASEILDDVWPTDAKPGELIAGPDVPKDQRQAVNKALSEVNEEIIHTVNNSNFRSAAHEALMDWTIGSGFLLPEEGDAVEPIRFSPLPLVEAIPDTGPHNTIDALFRYVKTRAENVEARWPGAKLSDSLRRTIETEGGKELCFIEGFERDWKTKTTERWTYRCVYETEKVAIKEGESRGAGSKPYIDFSYTRVGREIMGRGPVQIALPDIKTLNLAKQFLLEAGDLAIGGIYKAEDDGVVNPATIVLEPRTIIPYARGTGGLERVDTSTDLPMADLLIKELQAQIRAILLGDDLGPPQGTPMSATEVLQRTSKRVRRRAGPYTRLIVELLFPTYRRVAYILQKQGRIRLPAIDGKTIVFRPLAPITRAQAQDEILRHDRFFELANSRVGPQQTALFADSQKYLEFLARKLGVEPDVIRPLADRKGLVAAVASLQALAGEGGGSQPGLAA